MKIKVNCLLVSMMSVIISSCVSMGEDREQAQIQEQIDLNHKSMTSVLSSIKNLIKTGECDLEVRPDDKSSTCKLIIPVSNEIKGKSLDSYVRLAIKSFLNEDGMSLLTSSMNNGNLEITYVTQRSDGE